MLGRRKPISATTAEPDPDQRLADAEEALGAAVGELDAIRAGLGEHAQQRQDLLSGDGDVEQIAIIDREDYRLGLRETQVSRQISALQNEVQAAQAGVFEVRWRAYRPALVAGEQRLATAIAELYGALAALHGSHMEAHRRGFGARVGEFQKVPAGALAIDVVNDYALRQFLRQHRPDEAVAA